MASLKVCEKKDRPTGTNLRRTVKTSPQQVRKASKMIDTNDAKGRELLLPPVITFIEHDVTQHNVEHVQWMRRYDHGDPVHEHLQYCRLTRVACLMVTLNFLSRMQTYMAWGI